MGDDEDYSKFDPRGRWAEENNETITGIQMGTSDKKNLNRLIDYLSTEKTIAEAIIHLKLTRGQIIRYLTILRGLKGISLDRRDSKGVVGYRVTDFRKKN